MRPNNRIRTKTVDSVQIDRQFPIEALLSPQKCAKLLTMMLGPVCASDMDANERSCAGARAPCARRGGQVGAKWKAAQLSDKICTEIRKRQVELQRLLESFVDSQRLPTGFDHNVARQRNRLKNQTGGWLEDIRIVARTGRIVAPRKMNGPPAGARFRRGKREQPVSQPAKRT